MDILSKRAFFASASKDTTEITEDTENLKKWATTKNNVHPEQVMRSLHHASKGHQGDFRRLRSIIAFFVSWGLRGIQQDSAENLNGRVGNCL